MCDAVEIAVDVARAAAPLGLDLEPRPVERPLDEAITLLGSGRRVGVILTGAPPPADLCALASTAREAGQTVAAALLGPDASESVALAGDLGVVAAAELRAFVGALALVGAGAERPWAASMQKLPPVDRARLAPVLDPNARGGGRLARADDGQIGFSDGGTVVPIGEPRDAALAIAALAAAAEPVARAASILEGVDRAAVQEVLFGPPRPLSDPASKAALAPYGVPVPTEELCTSPSRAAAEAARIGFPVRIALASPDLRVWDHPDLAVDGVDNAARVRDVFRQMMTLAETRTPGARLLGVTVTATSVARALLRVSLSPLPEGLVLTTIGFADPHGLASGDHTQTALPAPTERVERVLGRLAGAPLLLAGTSAQRRESVAAIADVLLRLAAFVDDQRAEITRIEVDPMAVLIGGGVEVREACVHVGDAYLRSLEAPAVGG